jgi:NADPH-dependent curcumin reductase
MKMAEVNRQVWLRARPAGIPQAEHFALRDAPIPDVGEGELLVRNRILSVDPAMRGWIADSGTYWPRIEIGETMRAFAAGEVLRSRHPDYAEGDRLVGVFGWQDYAAAKPEHVLWRARDEKLPLSLSLGVLGLNGLTAYFGMREVCQPRPGETVVVSTAAGGVGSAAGQIARLAGCRVVGITGGSDKRRQCLEEFGFDAAIDYKAGDIGKAIAEACPQGIDCFFDNTSGAIHDAVLPRINIGARIAICGTASIMRWDPWPQGPRPERHLLVKRATMRGFLTTDFAARYDEALGVLTHWVRDGLLRFREEFLEGLDQAPGSIARLYGGANNGKLLIRI